MTPRQERQERKDAGPALAGAGRSRSGVASVGLALVGLALVGLGLSLAACGGGGSSARRDAGSVLWVDSRSGSVSEEALDELTARGVGEVFVQMAELAWEGTRLQWTSASRAVSVPHAPVTLVVGGTAPPPDLDAPAAAGELVERLAEAELEVQRRGGLPSGVHLHLAIPDEAALEPMTELTAALGTALGPDRPLSVTLPDTLLETPGARGLARVASALVVFLYGQDARGQESSVRWDLQAVEERLQVLESLGCDYLVGVVTLGRMTRRDRSGQPLESTTAGSVRRLLDQPGVEVALGSALQAVDGRVYDFEVRRGTSVGPWRLAPGERLRVRLLGAAPLRRFLELVAAPDWEHHLGQAYYRPPRSEEGMALPPAVLAGILAEEPPPARVEVQREADRRGNRLTVRLTVTNAGTESTEIAHVGNNFVDLRAQRGRFLSAERGDFQRYDQIDSGTGQRSIRSDTVRLHAPYLAAGETLRSGDLVFRDTREEDLVLGGTFLLPDGSTASVVAAAPPDTAEDEGSESP